MKPRLALTLAVLFALSLLSVAGLQATSGWTLQGCWSPFPTCTTAYDIYTFNGKTYRCGRCGTTTNPSTSTCQQVSLPPQYWCS